MNQGVLHYKVALIIDILTVNWLNHGVTPKTGRNIHKHLINHRSVNLIRIWRACRGRRAINQGPDQWSQ